MLVKKSFPVELKAVEGEGRSFWAVASTEEVDRDGDIIKAAGWKLDNFLKNPVIPWAHDYRQPPVAKADEIKVEGNKLLVKVTFAAADEYPFADTIYRLYKGGFLRAFSVGFMPLKQMEVVGRGPYGRGFDIEEAELHEVSAVTVPANPNALAMAAAKGIITDEEADSLRPDPLAGLKHEIDRLNKAIETIKTARFDPDREAVIPLPSGAIPIAILKQPARFDPDREAIVPLPSGAIPVAILTQPEPVNPNTVAEAVGECLPRMLGEAITRALNKSG